MLIIDASGREQTYARFLSDGLRFSKPLLCHWWIQWRCWTWGGCSGLRCCDGCSLLPVQRERGGRQVGHFHARVNLVPAIGWTMSDDRSQILAAGPRAHQTRSRMHQAVRRRLRIVYEVYGPRGERSWNEARSTCGWLPTAPPGDLWCTGNHFSSRIRVRDSRGSAFSPCDAKHAISRHGPVVHYQRKQSVSWE